jgi:hypothetical protein
MYNTYKGVQLRQGSPHRQHNDRAAACVIAQQYSSAICILFPFHSRKEKIRRAFQKRRFLFNFFLNCITWKVR